MGVNETSVKEIVEKMLGYLSIPATVTARTDAGTIVVEVNVEDPYPFTGKGGRGVEALQNLVQRIAGRTAEGEEPPPIAVDVNGYRKKREEELAGMAKEIAARVHASGSPVLLGAMPAWERKVIHMTLRDEAGLETVSEDSAAGRRVRIRTRSTPPPDQGAGGPAEGAK